MAISDTIYQRVKAKLQAQEIAVRDVRHMMPQANGWRKVYDAMKGKNVIGVHYDAQRRDPVYDAVRRYQEQGRYHINKVWGYDDGQPIYGFSLMYHWKIAGNGELFYCQPMELRTWSIRNGNHRTINICLDCGANQAPTKAQLKTLKALLDVLCFECPEFPAGQKNVWGHKETGPGGPGPNFGNSTDCPGQVLPYVVSYRNTRQIRTDLGADR